MVTQHMTKIQAPLMLGGGAVQYAKEGMEAAMTST